MSLPDCRSVGYIWLFVTGLFFMVRLLVDPMMVRRPLLEPNLSSGGLTFISISLLVFLLVNVLTKEPDKNDLEGPKRLRALLSRTETPADESSLKKLGPGFPPLLLLPSIVTRASVQPDAQQSEEAGRSRSTKPRRARWRSSRTWPSCLAWC